MLFLPDGAILVAERGDGNGLSGFANLRLVENGVTRAEPVLTLSTNVRLDSGLNAVAIDRDFANNGYIYILYAAGESAKEWDGTAHVRLSRFTYDFASKQADLASELVLIKTDSWRDVHHGHALWMDADGYLFAAFGDLDAQADLNLPFDLRFWEGKLLRIRPNANGYTIPADNPFIGAPGGHDEIYALGLRNPYRMAQRASDGLLVMGDVGGIEWEEVNQVQRAVNYGWPKREGPCPRGQVLPCADSGVSYADPLMTYPHNGDGRAVTGVAFYNGTGFPEAYQGNLFFADVTSELIGRISAENPTDTQIGYEPFATGIVTIVDLEYRENSLYALSYNLGTIYVIYHSGSDNVEPSAELTASPTVGPPSLTVNFSASAIDPDDVVLSYHWDFGDGSPALITNDPVASHEYTTSGTYIAELQVKDLRGGESIPATQRITVYDGEFPTISVQNLTAPGRDLYHAGDTLQYSAERTTLADLDPAAPFSWRIELHHNNHTHTYISNNSVFSDTLTIPTTNHDGDWRLWYELILTMKTETGQEIPVSLELFPAHVDLTFATEPNDTNLLINFVGVRSPHTLKSVVGIDNVATASPTMVVGQDIFAPLSWRWGSTTVTTTTIAFPAPALDTSYQATYQYARPADLNFLPVVESQPETE